MTFPTFGAVPTDPAVAAMVPVAVVVSVVTVVTVVAFSTVLAFAAVGAVATVTAHENLGKLSHFSFSIDFPLAPNNRLKAVRAYKINRVEIIIRLQHEPILCLSILLKDSHKQFYKIDGSFNRTGWTWHRQ